MAEGGTRAGFVAVLGAPNVGKSTLVNRLVGAKVAIVTPKVQTTRSRLRGIRVIDEVQLVFVDTPGIFAARHRFERAMVHAAWSGAHDADAILLLVDAKRGMTGETRAIIDRLEGDPARDPGRRSTRSTWCRTTPCCPSRPPSQETGLAAEIFMVSALGGDGVPTICWACSRRGCRPAPGCIPKTSSPTYRSAFWQRRSRASSSSCSCGRSSPTPSRSRPKAGPALATGGSRVEQVIYVQRETHKGIVLGKGGRQIKAIGTAARAELAQILGCPIDLKLFVKVRQRWLEDPERYRDIGLEYDV